jgi:Protein of unknown function (DUF3300)
MRRLTNLSASQTVWFPRLQLGSPEHSDPNKSALWPALRRMIALVMVIVLLPVWQGELLAQQAPPQSGGTQEDDGGQLPSDESGSPGQPDQYVDEYSQPGNGQAAVQPLDAERLQQLVAPIALYPDTLVALVLTASTYPTQVVEADRWRQMQGYASSEQVAAGADAQNWDPSIKALTAFPQVLAQMDRNLSWITDLGTAYYNQPSDTLEAVQVMRQRAQAAGNLEATPQEAVNYVGGNIQVAPVNPQLIYVPAYNPWTVYGAPISPYPGFSLAGALGSFFGSSAVQFGIGVALNAFTRMPWGLLAWGLSWLAQAVLFHNSNYYSHSTTVADWGFPHGGRRAAWRAFAADNRSRGFGSGYRPAPGMAFVHRPPDSYRYPGRGYNPGRTQAFVPRPPNSYSGYRSVERSGGAYQASGYARGPQQGYLSTTVHRPSPDERGLSARLQRPSFGQRSSAQFGGIERPGSYRKQVRADSHPFGGGHGSASFHANGHAPKMKGGKSYGGHSSGKHRH